MQDIMDCLTSDRCATFDDCLAQARRQFEQRFHHKIKQLVHMFPEDARTSNGSLFWSPPKRFPTAVPYDAADESHASYMQASAILCAGVYGIALPPWASDRGEVAKRAAAVHVRPLAVCCAIAQRVAVRSVGQAAGPPC